jgi:hypothetical protein
MFPPELAELEEIFETGVVSNTGTFTSDEVVLLSSFFAQPQITANTNPVRIS